MKDFKIGEWYKDEFEGHTGLSLFKGWNVKSIGFDYDGEFTEDHEWFFKENFDNCFTNPVLATRKEVEQAYYNVVSGSFGIVSKIKELDNYKWNINAEKERRSLQKLSFLATKAQTPKGNIVIDWLLEFENMSN